ncbi:TRAP transporter large permease [Thermodesulfobacteriota bacterium]
MTPVEAGILGLVLIFVLIAFGLPIGISMGVIGAAGVWYLISGDAALAKMAYVPYEVVIKYDLATLPLFILMAQIVFATGMARDMFDLASKWVGHQPGGLAMASVGAAAIFAAVSASSTATAATIGLVAIPEMKRYKYQQALATGSVAAGGTMGALIPPSGFLIIYALITETSIGRLFAAGIVPGVLEALFYMTTIYILCKWKPDLGPQGQRFSFREKIAAFGSCGEIIGLIILVLGGLLVGWFTPTEAGGVAAFGAILFSLLRKRLNWQKLREAFIETLKTAGMIYYILIGAWLFKYFLAVSTMPTIAANFISGLDVPPLVIVMAILVVYLFLGCIMDVLAMVLLTMPVFFPIILELGYDPIWFGIVLARMTEIGAITPPIGINVYVISGVAPDVPLQTIFKGIIPFFISDLCHVTLLLFVPAISLFLPNLFF